MKKKKNNDLATSYPMKLPCLLRLCQTEKEAQAERRHVSKEICRVLRSLTCYLIGSLRV